VLASPERAAGSHGTRRTDSHHHGTITNHDDNQHAANENLRLAESVRRGGNNHGQFYTNGNISSPTFGRVLKAAPTRIGQVVITLNF
jgi:hypothetical protein